MVDSVAHECLVDNHHFKEAFLRRTAETLANRLLTALAPLVKDKYRLEESSFEDELAGIFLLALEIKMLGMTPRHMFEFIWPSRNAKFDSDLMTEDILANDTNGKDLCDHEGKKVILTLVPGLRVHSCDRKLMDSRNFTTNGENGSGPSDLIVRARVLTG